jgi:benzoyl-CoA reductase/2-hydroxyglutaryl-CoA dehydratase subunit BcrC/BadD/HgdB
MTQKEFELSEEYQRGAAALAEFLEAREEWRATIKAANARGHKVSAADRALVDTKLREFDEMIEELEQSLAKEYERCRAEHEKEAKIERQVEKMWELQKHIYIHVKHETPHLLESFTERVLGPLPDDMREEFLDGVAILEATQLDAILKGEI